MVSNSDEMVALVIGFRDWLGIEAQHAYAFLREDTRLIKAGLLYADQVDLASDAALSALMDLHTVAPSLLTLDAFGPQTWSAEELVVHRTALDEHLNALTDADRSATNDFLDGAVAGAFRRFYGPVECANVLGQWIATGELAPGRIPLVGSVTAEMIQSPAWRTGQLAVLRGPGFDQMVSQAAERARDPSLTRAQRIAMKSVVSAIRREQRRANPKMFPSPVSRPREGDVLINVLGRTRAFPDAEWDVLFDVRDRLGGARAHLRAAISSAAEELRNASDVEIDRACASLQQQVIAPALAQMDQALEDLDAVPTLLRLSSDASTVGSVIANLALLASNPALVSVSPILHAAASAPVIASAARELLRRRERRQAVAAQPYWALYELSRRR